MKPNDAVERIIEQWTAERPDLELDPMLTIGRIKRCAALIQPKLEQAFAAFDLTFWEFDVLATLRRSGAPYRLTPTELFSTMMITSGTMTHRMKRLEQRNLIVRIENVADARSKQVQLSDEGFKLIDAAVTKHVENEKHILSQLSNNELVEIDKSLKKLLAVLEEH